MEQIMLRRLIKLANTLDQYGFYKEASELDLIIQTAMCAEDACDCGAVKEADCDCENCECCEK